MPEHLGTVEDYQVFDIPPNALPLDGITLSSLYADQQIFRAQRLRIGKQTHYDRIGPRVFRATGSIFTVHSVSRNFIRVFIMSIALGV